MGLQPGIARNEKDGFIIASFFSWLAWAAGTDRPGFGGDLYHQLALL